MCLRPERINETTKERANRLSVKDRESILKERKRLEREIYRDCTQCSSSKRENFNRVIHFCIHFVLKTARILTRSCISHVFYSFAMKVTHCFQAMSQTDTCARTQVLSNLVLTRTPELLHRSRVTSQISIFSSRKLPRREEMQSSKPVRSFVSNVRSNRL